MSQDWEEQQIKDVFLTNELQTDLKTLNIISASISEELDQIPTLEESLLNEQPLPPDDL